MEGSTVSTTDHPSGSGSGIDAETWATAQSSPEFRTLRRRLRSFVFPVSALFLAWYLVYVLLADYAHGFMSIKLIGNINIGLVLGLLQFVSTFVITTLYVRYANKELDPVSEQIRERLEGSAAAEAPVPADDEGDEPAAGEDEKPAPGKDDKPVVDTEDAEDESAADESGEGAEDESTADESGEGAEDESTADESGEGAQDESAADESGEDAKDENEESSGEDGKSAGEKSEGGQS